MIEFLTRLSLYVTAVTAATVLLGIFYQLGFFYIFGIQYLFYFSISDYIGSMVPWLAIIMGLFIAVVLIPIAHVSARVDRFVTSLAANWDRPLATIPMTGDSWRASLLRFVYRFIIPSANFLVAFYLLYIFSYFVYEVVDLYNASVMTEHKILVLSFVKISRGLVIELLIFSVGGMALATFSRWKPVVIWALIAVDFMAAAFQFGLENAHHVTTSNSDYVALQCKTVNCSGLFKILRVLSQKEIVLSEFDTKSCPVPFAKLMVLPADEILSTKQTVVLMPEDLSVLPKNSAKRNVPASAAGESAFPCPKK